MRTGAGFDANGGAAMGDAPSYAPGGPHSAWHSPVPYLFGGLAAMLGLIALALLILACSYWKLSSYLDSGDGADQPGPEKPCDAAAGKDPALPEERFLVIMAGDCAPTFLAVPIAGRAAAFAGNDAGADTNVEEANKLAESAVSSPGSDGTHNHMEGDQSQSQSQEQ